MQVSISKAAEMAGVTRATFYRHIDKKGISVTKDDDGNPKVDVSELMRVYGNKIKTLSESVSNDTGENTVLKQEKTPISSVELEVLKEKIKHIEESKAVYEEERKREREQFEERIEQLQSTLNKAQDNQTKTTALLEHYTKEGQGGAKWEESMKALEERLANQEKVAEEKLVHEAEAKNELLAKVSAQELEKKDLSKANKIYAGLALITVLSLLFVAAVQGGIINL